MRNIHLIVGHLDFLYVYMDDILIASHSTEEHLGHLQTLFKLLAEHCILVNPKKCQFACSTLQFLGHVVDKNGIRIPESRVDVIQKFPAPTSIKELERFLGLYAFVHRFG